MTIRKFETEDLEKLKLLLYQTIDICYSPLYYPESIEYYKNYHSIENILQDAHLGETIVLENKGILIGTSTLFNSTIKRMFIAPLHQHQNFGTMLMLQLEEIAIMKNLKKVDLCSTHTAVGFYEKLRYKVSEELIVELGTQKLVYYNMFKELNLL